MQKVKYLTKLHQIEQLSEEEREALQPVSEKFVFRTNDYYNSLIDWDDPGDPLRRLVIPDVEELKEWGGGEKEIAEVERLDASHEEEYTVVPGLEHKYPTVGLLLVNDVCGAYCRFCFRKRLFMDDNDEVVKDISQGVEYIRQHPEISNVLLTGGDPLIMSSAKLEKIFAQLREIDHVKIIRIGSKMPAFNPYRTLNDPKLSEVIQKYSTPEKRIYIMCHFNHPRELTEPAIQGVNQLLEAGAILINQSPMIRGINDDPVVLSEMFNTLSYIGVPPYYVFQCRPTEGNYTYSVPLEEASDIFEKAKTRSSGLAKRARFSMSHRTGKIEILGKSSQHMIFRYIRAHDPANSGKLMMFRRNPDAHWFDDYTELVDEYSPGWLEQASTPAAAASANANGATATAPAAQPEEIALLD